MKYQMNEFSDKPKKRKGKRWSNALLWRGAELVLHFSPKCNELNNPMVLPHVGILCDIHIVFGVIQFDNSCFFPRSSPFLLRHTLVLYGFFSTSLLGSLCEINCGTWSGGGRCRETQSCNWWHEGMWIEKWHLIARSRKTLKKRGGGMEGWCAQNSFPR